MTIKYEEGLAHVTDVHAHPDSNLVAEYLVMDVRVALQAGAKHVVVDLYDRQLYKLLQGKLTDAEKPLVSSKWFGIPNPTKTEEAILRTPAQVEADPWGLNITKPRLLGN